MSYAGIIAAQDLHDIVWQALQIVADFYHGEYDGDGRQRAVDIACVNYVLAMLVGMEQADVLLNQGHSALDQNGDIRRAVSLCTSALSVIGEEYPPVAELDAAIWLRRADEENGD